MSLNAPPPVTTPTSSNPSGWYILSRLGIFFVAIFCIFCSFGVARRRVTSRIVNERGPLQRHHSIEMTPTTLDRHRRSPRHEYDWDAFNRWIETSNLLILYLSGNLVIPLPKRCIGSPQRIEQCRQLFREKIDTPRTARHAFAVLPAANVLPMPPLQNDPSLPR